MKTIDLSIKIKMCQMDELKPDEQQLVKKAVDATANSYSPYSHFSVGACVRLEDGSMIIGANQENSAFPVGLCAERTAIFAAQAHHPELAITDIAIAAKNVEGKLVKKPVSPCGSCRQVILEMEERYKRPVRIFLYGTEGVYVVDSVKDMLPLCFIGEDMCG